MALTPVPSWLLLCLLYVATGVFSQVEDVSPPLVNFDCSKSTPQQIGTGSGNPRRRRQASKLTTWPWMALLGNKTPEGTKWMCAGTLIHEQWVLTTDACASATLVRLGEYDHSDDADGARPQDYEVAEGLFHPDRIPLASYYRLALLRLNTTVNMQRFISPVCLPWGEESSVDVAGQQGSVLSFENYFHLDSSSEKTIQREIAMTIFSGAECDGKYSKLETYNRTFPQGIGEEHLCAADLVDSRDACKGDSGAALVTQDPNGRYVAAGIVEGGVGCGNRDFPGYYINLRYPPHLAWIKKVAFGIACQGLCIDAL